MFSNPRLASVSILGKEREPGVSKLGWNGNSDTGFLKEIWFKISWCGFYFNIIDIAIVY